MLGFTALAYIASQACKLVVCAVLVPSQEENNESFEAVQELFKCLVSLVDVAAVSYALNYGKTGANDHNPTKLAASVLGTSTL